MGAEHGAFGLAESGLQYAVSWLRLVIEAVGAAIIAFGVVIALGAFLRTPGLRNDAIHAAEGYKVARLTLARYLALALEFQLGADILSTAVAPTWTAIGMLGAIAVIRTGLNYFLGVEMNEAVHREVTLRERGAH